MLGQFRKTVAMFPVTNHEENRLFIEREDPKVGLICSRNEPKSAFKFNLLAYMYIYCESNKYVQV